jgi:hypothetical protein
VLGFIALQILTLHGRRLLLTKLLLTKLLLTKLLLTKLPPKKLLLMPRYIAFSAEL